MTTAEYGTAPEAPDALTCPCGNTCDTGGFYPCQHPGGAATVEVEPTPGAWDGRHVACAACGRTFDNAQHDGARIPVVAGPRDYIPLR